MGMVPLPAVMAMNPTPVGQSDPNKSDGTMDKAGVICDKRSTYSHDAGLPLVIKSSTSPKWQHLFNQLRCQTKKLLNWRRLALGTVLSNLLKPLPALAILPMDVTRYVCRAA